MPVTTRKAHDFRVWVSRRQMSVADGRPLLYHRRQPLTRRLHPQQRRIGRHPATLRAVFCGSGMTTARLGRYLVEQLLQQRNLLGRLHHSMMAPPVAACSGSGRIPGRLRGSLLCRCNSRAQRNLSQSQHVEGSSNLPGTATAMVQVPRRSRTSRAVSLG